MFIQNLLLLWTTFNIQIKLLTYRNYVFCNHVKYSQTFWTSVSSNKCAITLSISPPPKKKKMEKMEKKIVYATAKTHVLNCSTCASVMGGSLQIYYVEIELAWCKYFYDDFYDGWWMSYFLFEILPYCHPPATTQRTVAPMMTIDFICLICQQLSKILVDHRVNHSWCDVWNR